MRIASFFISLFLTLFIFSCTTTEPPDKEDPPDPVVIPSLTLTEDDTHCVESWLKLSADSLELPAELVLWQYNPAGDSISILINIATNDTLLHIDSLWPDKEYSFIAAFPEPDSLHPSSNIVTVTTMDTTSHDFTFDMLTFGGDYGSCALYDCAIIDGNNIWAVGEITIGDSSSRGYSTYNAVHWDGYEWRLKRIPYYYGSSTIYGGIYAIEAFGENDIWFGAGNLIHWDGHSYNPIETGSAFSSLINEMWGTGTDNLYIVGNDGNIALYDGTYWQKIESGTELNINDIWGDYNEKTREWEILVVASNTTIMDSNAILKISELTVQNINNSGLPWSLKSIYFLTHNKYYTCGDGLYSNNSLGSDWVKDSSFITLYKDKIRGQEINDILVSGAFGLLSHFNGLSWKHFSEDVLSTFHGRYRAVDIKDNILVAVGRVENSAIITAGIR